ncbi:MAG: F-box protein [Chlamydiales bacterium]|nr:F-box protein [Chlamydiales bacterium]
MITRLTNKIFHKSSQQEIVSQHDLISNLSEEKLVEIFTLLSLDDLQNCVLVSRKWKRIILSDQVLNLNRYFPSEKIFDSCRSKKLLNLSVDSQSYVPNPPNIKTFITLRQIFSDLKKQNINEAILLTIPKGFSINKISKLKSSSLITKGIEDKSFIKKTTKFSYKILITSQPLENSTNKDFQEQLEVLGNQGFQMPKIHEVVAWWVAETLDSSNPDQINFKTRCDNVYVLANKLSKCCGETRHFAVDFSSGLPTFTRACRQLKN